MIIRQLKQYQYDRLTQDLAQSACAEPLEACYTVYMTIGSLRYGVKLQPESGCRMAVLQAHQIHCGADGQNFELVTQSSLLAALLELIIFQGVEWVGTGAK